MFKSLDKSENKFEIVKLHLINKKGFTEFTILDSKTLTPFFFQCPNCKKCGSIDISKTNQFDSEKIKIDLTEICKLGGTGFVCKLIKCESCSTYFFVGIGYTEPNYGRDVYFLHNIIELKKEPPYKTLFTKISSLLEKHLKDRVTIENSDDGKEHLLNIKNSDVWLEFVSDEIIIGNGYNHLHIGENYGNVEQNIQTLLDFIARKKRITEYYKGEICYKRTIEIEHSNTDYELFSSSSAFFYPFWKKTEKEVFFEDELINKEVIAKEIEEIKMEMMTL